jgi:hypothetical protein
MRLGLFSIAFITTLVFFILKVTAVITWSWWLVFLPLLIWVGIVALLLLGFFIFTGLVVGAALKD